MFAKLAGARAHLGWSNGILYIASRGIEALSGGRIRLLKYYFVAQPVLREPIARQMPNAAVQIGEVQIGDPIVRQFPRPASVIARRFADGAHCFVARKHDQFIGFLWIQMRDYIEDEVRCLYQLEPAGVTAWDFDVYVASEYRFSRVFVRLWDEANEFLWRGGYRWSLSHISAFNPASVASHRRLGMRRLHTGVFFQLGRFQVAMLTCTPFIHLAHRPSDMLILRLRAPDNEGDPG